MSNARYNSKREYDLDDYSYSQLSVVPQRKCVTSHEPPAPKDILPIYV